MPSRVSLPAVLGAGALALGLAACAHRGPPAPSGPSQALPVGAPERRALRENLLHYLLDPVLALKPETLRREAQELENNDAGERVLDSFRDALGLFDPAETWSVPAGLSPAEHALLEPAARFVLSIFSPQGAQQPVTLAVAALTTLAAGTPDARAWSDRLDELVRWSEETGETT